MFGNELRLKMKVYIKKNHTLRNIIIAGGLIFLIFMMLIANIIITELFGIDMIGTILPFIGIPLIILVIIIIPFTRYKNHINDFVIINDNLDFYIQNVKLNARFNLIERYKLGKAKIINYTYSETLYIKVKHDKYTFKLNGDTSVRNTLVPIFRSIGLTVHDVDDEPSDDIGD